ncbi:hypothetical protein N0V84_005502 [Fusarium piperis]|uniref:F-box domain-containing protein n=1 Tax=Fusarium piperis TaxID=1435070 RepID=A0A9W8WDS9_9HYPO|nr:hypothetical protein N0V84_005502 [Fusarium piperis]
MQNTTDRSIQRSLASPGHARTKRQVIDDFLADLSPWDILYLRGRVRGVVVVLAGLQDLPPELIYLILPYLSIQDFQACILVCRAWAAVWTQNSVLARACRKFFPGLLETYPTMPGGQLFSLACKKRNKLQRPFSKHNWLRWDQGDSPIFLEPTPPSQPGPAPVDSWYPSLYAKERLAWQPGLDRVIVDNLCTRERLRFLPPGGAMEGTRFRLACLSDQLLVMREVNQPNRRMFIADLATKEWKTISLPGPFATAHAEGKTVGIGTSTGQIVVFNWDGKTTQLDLANVQTCPPESERLYGGVANVLPHPTQENVVFAVWVCSRRISSEYTDHLCKQAQNKADYKQISFVVVKFEDDQPVWSATEDLPNPRRHNKDCRQEGYLGLSFACKKADSHGCFALGIYRTQNQTQALPSVCYGCLPAKRVGDWGAISFNVFTQSFKHYEYKSTRPDLLWLGSPQPHRTTGRELIFVDTHLWNEDLLLAASTADEDMRIDLHLQLMHPVGSGFSYAGEPYWAPIRLRDKEHAAKTRIFQDDDLVVVPTIGGVAIFEPSDSLSRGRPVDDISQSQNRSRPLNGWESETLIVIRDDPAPGDPSVINTMADIY